MMVGGLQTGLDGRDASRGKQRRALQQLHWQGQGAQAHPIQFSSLSGDDMSCCV